MKAWTSVFVESMSRDRQTRRSWHSQWKPDEQTPHWQRTCPERGQTKKSLLEHGHDHLLGLFLCQTVPTDQYRCTYVPMDLCCQAELQRWTSTQPTVIQSSLRSASAGRRPSSGWHHLGRSPVVWQQLRCHSDDSANTAECRQRTYACSLGAPELRRQDPSCRIPTPVAWSTQCKQHKMSGYSTTHEMTYQRDTNGTIGPRRLGDQTVAQNKAAVSHGLLCWKPLSGHVNKERSVGQSQQQVAYRCRASSQSSQCCGTDGRRTVSLASSCYCRWTPATEPGLLLAWIERTC